MADVPKGSKMCSYCGKFFVSKTAAKFCSDECRQTSDKKRWRKTNNNNSYAYPVTSRSYHE